MSTEERPEKFRENASVLENTEIGTGIFDLRLRAPGIVRFAEPGQFVSVYSRDRSRLLPRPISICGAEKDSGELRLVFRIAGRGTEEFSKLRPGDRAVLTGPLGHGFPTGRAHGTVLLLGGGIGIPPLAELAKRIREDASRGEAGRTADVPDAAKRIREDASRGEAGRTADVPDAAERMREEDARRGKTGRTADLPVAAMRDSGTAGGEDGALRLVSVLGFRDELFLTEDLRRYGEVVIATEDGGCGTKGNVLDAIRENGLRPDVIYACGPMPMLRAVKTYAEARGTECWLSLEEKMACGIGACLSCVCRSAEPDAHSGVRNKRVCTEGPVFRSTEVIL